MKPFLLLATRDLDVAADDEYTAVRQFTGLAPAQLHRIRVETEPLGEIDLDEYSGLLLGGSQFTSSDGFKSAHQIRVEADLRRMVDRVIEIDYPFLGMCYGVGVVTTALGGVVDATYAEQTGAVWVDLTEVGRADPVLSGAPGRFQVFVGHKEACMVVPPAVAILATGAACPVQMYRVKQNIYVTQFHPELDAEGLVTRMTQYVNNGYFAPEELAEKVAQVRAAGVEHFPHLILRNFVERYARP